MTATKKQCDQIKRVYNALAYELSTIDWTNYGQKLLELTLEESKQHDRFRGDSIRRGISVLNEARYFAVKRVIEYVDSERGLDASEFFSMQRSCFAVFAIATNKRFKEVLPKWLEKHGAEAREIATWDYCELIAEVDNRRGFKSSPVETEAAKN